MRTLLMRRQTTPSELHPPVLFRYPTPPFSATPHTREMANTGPHNEKHAHSSSFVYPVRSLLTGIQPATIAETSSTNRSDSERLYKSSSASDLTTLHDLLTFQLKSSKRPAVPQIASYKSLSNFTGQPFAKPTLSSTLQVYPTNTTRKNASVKGSSIPNHSIDDITSNFRDFSPEEDPFRPHTFVTAPDRPHFPPTDSVAKQRFTLGPTGETLPYPPSTIDHHESCHSVQLDKTAGGIFYEKTADSHIAQRLSYTNISQSGIVHLGSSGSSSHGSRSDQGASAAGFQKLFSGHSGTSSDRRRQRSLNSSSPEGDPPPCRSDTWQSFPSRPCSDDQGSSALRSYPADEQLSEEKFFAVRYQHAQDEDGHHIVIGREGHINRCEDEPIRTPGAVQGFGVLIAVAEDEEAETLVVRQVSENSSDLLGLSPRYLFSLECFTDVLSDSQANLLWDNVQFLNDSQPSQEEQDNIHVFLLNGWGQPGSDKCNNDSSHRREWTCWCAVHRPVVAKCQTASSLIIMEFELERDILNPLYPPLVDSKSGVSSPGSGSTSSGTTLVSSRSEGHAPSSKASTGSEQQALSSSSNSSQQSSSEQVSSRVQASENFQESKEWMPTPEEILESTTSRSKPLTALQRLRRISPTLGIVDSNTSSNRSVGRGRRRRGAARRKGNGGSVGMMDLFAVMAQITDQLGAADNLEMFLKVVVGVIKDLTQFHRVMVYQFDEAWNGQVVSELVDWSQTHDLYRGLHFPAGDIPAQARHLYTISKVRLLYDRVQPTARLVVRNQDDLNTPLDMTHCYLRAFSPIHLKYLENMGVRASMSVSVMAFDSLWGLVTCHSYGSHGMRVSFPVRQMLRLLIQAISKNIERLSYAQRLQTRKLINTMPTDQHPTGYIVSNADDLLGLFDADYGVLVIGEGAKILGPNEHGQEILIVAEYLRLKRFTVVQISQAVTTDFPDLQLSTGLEVIAGLLYVPLSSGGSDFIAFLRKGQRRQVNWAGKPYSDSEEGKSLEPRKSFKIWSETMSGRCRVWTDEQVETAGVLALVYGKFIQVWRQKENVLQTTKLTNIILSNAGHEVRTPLNHIINYLELALNGPLDGETRENLSESHAASKSLLFTINDLLDLTRSESGQDTSFNEPFNLHTAIEEATQMYKNEAGRRNLQFELKLSSPKIVIGDSKKIRTVVANLTANALKYSTKGTITVECRSFGEPEGLRDPTSVAIEVLVSDNGCGISATKLESIFREFEQVESANPKMDASPGLGLGLAVVARIVEQLGGQLRVDSEVNQGSRFSFLIPFGLHDDTSSFSSPSSSCSPLDFRSRTTSGSDIDGLVSALQLDPTKSSVNSSRDSPRPLRDKGEVVVQGSNTPVRPITVDEYEINAAISKRSSRNLGIITEKSSPSAQSHSRTVAFPEEDTLRPSLRVLVVEDNEINSKLLGKRLTLDGHAVVYATNGQDSVDIISSDREFDCVLMDIQMPLLNGYEATERIRGLEKRAEPVKRATHMLNGRLPIFAVSTSLFEEKRKEMARFGIDGWILKPINFKRLRAILLGVTDSMQRQENLYREGHNWESGGWLTPCIQTSASAP